MKTSRTKFVVIFLISAFTFQFISNFLLAPEVRLFPVSGDWFPGTGSSVAWKHTISTMIYPVKFILIAPLSFLGKDPDPVPLVLGFAFSIYWTALAFLLHYLLKK